MSEAKVFFQDFLFKNMPVDEQDYPSIEPQRLPEGADISNYTIISLDTMLKMNRPIEWEKLFKQIENKNVCIKDDVVISNSELEPYKHFYLSAYYYNLSKYSKKVYYSDAKSQRN